MRLGFATLRRATRLAKLMSMPLVLTTSSVAVALRHSTTVSTPPAHRTGGGERRVEPVPDLPDLGPIDTQPAKSLQLERDVAGAWVLMAGELQGELHVDRDGLVTYRPASGLGYGVGRLTLKDGASGITTFDGDMEVYVYETTSRWPPRKPSKYCLRGAFATASAASHQFQTLTMGGHLTVVEHYGQHEEGARPKPIPPPQQLNAAKLSPGEAPAESTWQPNPQLQEAFKAIFPVPLRLGRLSPSAPALDLERHRIGNIPSLYYVPEYLSTDEESECLQHLKQTPQELRSQLDRRVVQEYGCTMCDECKQSFLSDANLPPWTEEIGKLLLKDRVFSATTFPNNVRVHEYDVGQGIAPHVDGPIYVPIVAIVSLEAPVLMSFYPKQMPYGDVMKHYDDTFKFDGPIAKTKPQFSVILEPRSLVVFTDDLYYYYPHGISDKAEDSLLEADCGPVVNWGRVSQVPREAASLKRSRRVGITIRNLLPRCSHHPERLHHFLRQALQGTQPPRTGATHPTSGSVKITREPLAPAAIVRPAGLTGDHPQNGDALLDTLRRIERQQTELLAAVRDVQVVLAHQQHAQQEFKQDMGTVVDHLTTTVLDIQNQLQQSSSTLPPPPRG